MRKSGILIFILFILLMSCKKPEEKGYCDVECTTQKGEAYYATRDSAIYETDYQLIYIKFGIERTIPYMYVPCSAPNDTVIGNIDYIDVIATYYYSNDTVNDTINNLLEATINNFDDKQTMDLTTVNSSHPNCGNWLKLNFTTPPVLNCFQSYTIYYKEVGREEIWTYAVPEFYLSQ